MQSIVAFVVRDGDAYGVMFPDFPGALTGGDTRNEALGRARDTIQAHVEALIEADMPLPELRSIDAIEADESLAGLRKEADMVAVIEISENEAA